ncbi:MAG: hypothetical protein NC218_03420 [Acetobacter sp.]|nr:hypothetical protein [Acetobacter sp.]
MSQKKIDYSIARDFHVKTWHIWPRKCVLCHKKIKGKFVMKVISHVDWNEKYRFCCPDCAKRWQLGERHPDVKKPTEDEKLRDFLMEPVEIPEENRYE